MLYLKDKEMYFSGFSYLGLAGILKSLPFKMKNSARFSLRRRCVLTNQRLITAKSYKMTRMVYKLMLNTSKINGVRVTKR